MDKEYKVDPASCRPITEADKLKADQIAANINMYADIKNTPNNKHGKKLLKFNDLRDLNKIASL